MSRPKRRAVDADEDASKLALGKEFVEAPTLNVGEVKYLLERRAEDKGRPDNAVYKKTYDYVSMFTKFSDIDQLSRVHDVFKRDPTLKAFETAQLANLCPMTAEEAKAIIPSLEVKADDPLGDLLHELDSVRRFTA